MMGSVVMFLVKFIVIGCIVSAYLLGMACVLKAVAYILKAIEEEEEEADDK